MGTRTSTVGRRVALAAPAVVVAALAAFPAAAAPATKPVSAKLSNFKIAVAPKSAGHGKVTFDVKNTAAGVEHELVVIKTSRKAANLPVNGEGEASEKGSVGEVELGGGKSKKLTLNLKAGHYAVICNIGSHYKLGMHADFTVK